MSTESLFRKPQDFLVATQEAVEYVNKLDICLEIIVFVHIFILMIMCDSHTKLMDKNKYNK